jgi:hypothetical protein
MKRTNRLFLEFLETAAVVALAYVIAQMARDEQQQAKRFAPAAGKAPAYTADPWDGFMDWLNSNQERA